LAENGIYKMSYLRAFTQLARNAKCIKALGTAPVLQTGKRSLSVFRFPPIPEDGVYRRPVAAPPTAPVSRAILTGLTPLLARNLITNA